MFKPAPMTHTSLVVLEDDLDRATSQIVRQGMWHLVQVTEIASWAEHLERPAVAETIAAYQDLRKKITALAARLRLKPEFRPDRTPLETTPPEALAARYEPIAKEVSTALDQRATAEEATARLEAVLARLKRPGPLSLPIDLTATYSFVEMASGRVTPTDLEQLRRGLADIPHVLLPFPAEEGRIPFLAIVLRRHRLRLETALREAATERLDVTEEEAEARLLKGEDRIRAELDHLREEIARADESLAECRARFHAVLDELYTRTRLSELQVGAKHFYRRTGRAYLISGWIPREQAEPLAGAVSEACTNRCYVEQHSPGELEQSEQREVDVPVLFRNPPILKPFELLVGNYGVPAYGTLDPTPFVALSYLVMFGVMFGDVGQGLVIAALGAVLAARRRAPETRRRFGGLLVGCGLSAALFGFLFGSVFGSERLIEPLWLRPLDNITLFFRTAVLFGVAMVSIGIALSVVNALSRHRFAAALFDKAGLLGGVIYWIGVGLVIKFLTTGLSGRSALVLLGAIAAAVFLFFLRRPLGRILPGRHDEEGGVAESLVELLEILTGYLANTVSFVRVAAFALAHAGLFITVFTIADILGQAAGPLAWLAHVVGNAVIIGLEGLIVSIQAMRLEYYEFFSKFFRPGARAYQPISLAETEGT